MRWQEAQDRAREKLKPNETKMADRFQTPDDLLKDLERLKEEHTGSLTEKLIAGILPCFQVMLGLYVLLMTWMPHKKIQITLLWGILHIIVKVFFLNHSSI